MCFEAEYWSIIYRTTAIRPYLLLNVKHVGIDLVGFQTVREEVYFYDCTETEIERVGSKRRSLCLFTTYTNHTTIVCLYALLELTAICIEISEAIEPEA